jgi:hypothetical protein
MFGRRPTGVAVLRLAGLVGRDRYFSVPTGWRFAPNNVIYAEKL